MHHCINVAKSSTIPATSTFRTSVGLSFQLTQSTHIVRSVPLNLSLLMHMHSTPLTTRAQESELYIVHMHVSL